MLARKKNAPESLNVSALDLFASALGVFILIAILMFPYYLRQPSIEADVGGAKAELAAAEKAVVALEEQEAAAREARLESENALEEAQRELTRLQSLASQSEAKLENSQLTADAAARELGAVGRKLSALAISDMDLVFVMDTTASMGDELSDIKSNLRGILRVLQRLVPSLRVGFVAFKDRTDEYVTRVYPLRAMTPANAEDMLRFVKALRAGGGGDIPEPIDAALAKALAMSWRVDTAGRVIVIGDATPHRSNIELSYRQARDFRDSAGPEGLPRNVSTIYTGDSPRISAYFQRLAEAGGGDFNAHKGQMIESVLLSVLQ